MAYYPLKIKDSSGNTHTVGDPRTANKADLASPAFTGTPTAPTSPVGTDSTQLATTAFVNAEISNDAVLISVVDAAGDLLVGSANNAVGRLALGNNGEVLTVDTAGSGVTKVKWAALASTGGGLEPFFFSGV